jgi:hypothetical protein
VRLDHLLSKESMGCYQQHTDSQLVHWSVVRSSRIDRRFSLSIRRTCRRHRLFRSLGALPQPDAGLEPASFCVSARLPAREHLALENCIASTSIYSVVSSRPPPGGRCEEIIEKLFFQATKSQRWMPWR